MKEPETKPIVGSDGALSSPAATDSANQLRQVGSPPGDGRDAEFKRAQRFEGTYDEVGRFVPTHENPAHSSKAVLPEDSDRHADTSGPSSGIYAADGTAHQQIEERQDSENAPNNLATDEEE